jgi:hypothetical protein
MAEDLNGLRVKSAIADKKQVTLYLEDGNTKIVKTGDPRLPALLDQIIPIISELKVAVVNLEEYSVFASFEKQSAGVVKFFKIDKARLKGWFTADKDAFGNIPSELVSKPMEPAKDDNVTEDQTIIAVIDGITIPEVEKVKPYLAHAIKHSNEKAVINFLHRLVPMMEKRKHSIQDILRFMEKGDLPIADDGSIIAYKVLRRKNGHYVDVHSGNVPQKIGSYVCVDESLVDLNRSNECSNGLHIARRAYLGSFGGDVCVLCKVAPEDIVVVPHGDPNKVRTKGYHILEELSRNAWDMLKSNRAATSIDDTADYVAKAMRGDHVKRIEEVRITEQRGGGIKITMLDVKARKSDRAITKEDRQKAQAIDDETNNKIDPKAINKKVNEENKRVAAKKKAAAKKSSPPVKKSGKKNAVSVKSTPKAQAKSSVKKNAPTSRKASDVQKVKASPVSKTKAKKAPKSRK